MQQFSFGRRTVSAIAEAVDNVHSNVLRLSITRTTFERRTAAILQHLPIFIQKFARSIGPKYFLPRKVILKSLKPEWEDEFDNEKVMYKRLERLQGRFIPIFLGEAEYNGSPAILLSHIDGVLPFAQDPKSPITAEEFETHIEFALREFAKDGLVHGDTKLDNFVICGDHMVVVDLESVCEETEHLELAITSHLSHTVKQYKSYLENRHEYY